MWQVKSAGISTNRSEVPVCPCICSFGSAVVDSAGQDYPDPTCGCQCAYGVENMYANLNLAQSYTDHIE